MRIFSYEYIYHISTTLRCLLGDAISSASKILPLFSWDNIIKMFLVCFFKMRVTSTAANKLVQETGGNVQELGDFIVQFLLCLFP